MMASPFIDACASKDLLFERAVSSGPQIDRLYISSPNVDPMLAYIDPVLWFFGKCPKIKHEICMTRKHDQISNLT